MAQDDRVTIPRAMYDSMEEQIIELHAIKAVLKDSSQVLHPFSITTVITSPPSGSSATAILTAIQHLVAVSCAFGMRKKP